MRGMTHEQSLLNRNVCSCPASSKKVRVYLTCHTCIRRGVQHWHLPQLASMIDIKYTFELPSRILKDYAIGCVLQGYRTHLLLIQHFIIFLRLTFRILPSGNGCLPRATLSSHAPRTSSFAFSQVKSIRRLPASQLNIPASFRTSLVSRPRRKLVWQSGWAPYLIFKDLQISVIRHL